MTQFEKQEHTVLAESRVRSEYSPLITSSRQWLQVCDIMTEDVRTIQPNASVVSAAKIMGGNNISCLVVMEADSLVGILTERDILTRIVAAKVDPSTTKIEEVMSSPLAVCGPETTLDECQAVMTEKRIRHLPVVKDGQLLGIITSGDILYQEGTKHSETIKYLQEYIHGPYANS